MTPPVITLLTDFGTRDPYVAAMKGVILSICPEARIVDLTHDIEKHDIRQAAFVLLSCYKYFPRGTIHVVVVDPGVGTRRRAVVIKTRRYFFVGPDNGVLQPAACDDNIVECREISNTLLMRSSISRTFHGRDVFAPVAAYIAKGVPLRFIGPEVEPETLVKLYTPTARVEMRSIEGRVIYIDSFGNVVTNIDANTLRKIGVHYGDIVGISVGRRHIVVKLCRTYGEVGKGELLALIDSFNYLEIAVNQGKASEILGARIGDRVRVTRHEQDMSDMW
ncbi:MAG: hypothetical protein DRN15_03170 [Thermoprotei archaeon]|nr:MAG: hypothetical protein DRN15_03170 [Thermoprotei archaeon]